MKTGEKYKIKGHMPGSTAAQEAESGRQKITLEHVEQQYQNNSLKPHLKIKVLNLYEKDSQSKYYILHKIIVWYHKEYMIFEYDEV